LASLPDLPAGDALKRALRHVLWLGGAPDAGKTSVAREIAGRHGLHLYHLDSAEPSHIARTTPERQLTFAAFLAMTMDQRWVTRSPAEMAEQVVSSSAERLPLILADVLAMPKEPGVLAEGPWLFPELITPLLSDPRQAVWLEPTAAFKRASAARRDKPGFRHETSDPDRATRNWWERDVLIAVHIRRGVAERGLALLTVDGSRPLDEMVALVEQHFGPLLPGA